MHAVELLIEVRTKPKRCPVRKLKKTLAEVPPNVVPLLDSRRRRVRAELLLAARGACSTCRFKDVC